MKEQQLFYVGIKEPIDLRRDVLEASKITLRTLHSYEKFKSIKQRKHYQMKTLRDLLRQLNREVTGLKSLLPILPKIKQIQHEKDELTSNVKARSTGSMAKSAKRNFKPMLQDTAKQKPALPELTDLEKLEHEISAIERQLNTL